MFFCARSPNAFQWFGRFRSPMFRIVPTVWILCDHFWLVTELLIIGFGFEGMVERNSTLKGPELKLAFWYHWYEVQKCHDSR